jgi:uncharacterized membrane protein
VPKRRVAPKPDLSRAELILVRLAFSLAFAISAYLAWNSLQGGGVPGCGPDSGCDKVLGSRWAYVLGLPVSLFALPVYLGTIVLLFQKTIRWKIILPLAAVVLGAALWFVGLQGFALRAFCKFCMTAHALGAIAALVLLRNNPLPANVTAKFVGLAALPIALVIIAQVNSSAPGPVELASKAPVAATNSSPIIAASNSLPANETNSAVVAAPSGPNFSFVDGEFTVDLTKVPVSGRLDAPKKMVKLFDFTCHHCRDLHHLLKPVKQKYPNELAVISLPMPLDSDCNPLISRTAPPHTNACEIARIALAVFVAKPEKFEEFADWLFEPELPPTPEAAQAQAEKLVGKEAFAAASRDPRVEEQIRMDVNIYAATGRKSGRSAMPQLLFAQGGSIGAVPNAQSLNKILFKSLGLGEPPPPKTNVPLPLTNAPAVK